MEKDPFIYDPVAAIGLLQEDNKPITFCFERRDKSPATYLHLRSILNGFPGTLDEFEEFTAISGFRMGRNYDYARDLARYWKNHDLSGLAELSVDSCDMQLCGSLEKSLYV